MDINQYFQERIGSQAWDNAQPEDRIKAEKQANRELEPYREKVDPVRFFYAVCEQAIWLLEGGTRAKLQQDGVKSAGMGRASETFDLKGRPSHIAPFAWSYLQPPKRAGRIV